MSTVLLQLTDCRSCGDDVHGGHRLAHSGKPEAVESTGGGCSQKVLDTLKANITDIVPAGGVVLQAGTTAAKVLLNVTEKVSWRFTRHYLLLLESESKAQSQGYMFEQNVYGYEHGQYECPCLAVAQ
jgi:hypothetical protein